MASTSDVATIFRTGTQNDMPVTIGSNSHEGSIFTPETTTGQSFGTFAFYSNGGAPAVPELPSLLMLGTGLVVVAARRRCKTRKTAHTFNGV